VRTIWRRLLTLLGPFVLTGLVIAGIALWQQGVAYELGVISVASFFGFGTTVIFSSAVLGENIHLRTWEIALWMIYLNAAAAFLYAYNLDLLERVPWIGPYLKRARHNVGETLKRNPWIRRMAEAGIVLFVLSPLPGSGQLGGCFIGRVIGLPRRTVFFVVTLAGVAVATFYAMFAGYLAKVFDRMEMETWMRVLLFVLALVLAWLIFKFLRYLGREEPAVNPEN